MQYKEIVSVTGLSGLYQLLTTKSDGAIVRNIGDKTTKFISARQHNVTPLESIEVYTTSDNVRLQHVFQLMQQNEGATPLVDPRTASKDAITSYFKTVFPEFDEERVYVSDMKKMLKWYELLKTADLLHFEAPATEEAIPEEAPAPVAEEAPAAEEKPAKKAAAKKKKAEPADGETAGEKPAKKAAPKKKKTEE